MLFAFDENSHKAINKESYFQLFHFHRGPNGIELIKQKLSNIG